MLWKDIAHAPSCLAEGLIAVRSLALKPHCRKQVAEKLGNNADLTIVSRVPSLCGYT